MKKVNLLSRDEMKKVIGGVFPIQALFESCIASSTIGLDPGTTEYEIVYNMCVNTAENMCAQEIAMGRECWLST